MRIYIRTQGSRVVQEGRHLLVKKGEDTYHTLFVEKLEQVVLFGNVELTPAARAMLLRHGVDTVFCSKNGRYQGRFATPEPKNVMLRKRQFALLDDQAFAARFCRAVVAGKLTNMATLLMRISRSRNRQEPSQKAREIRALLPPLEETSEIASLRGYEGRGSALYFAGLPWGLQDNLGFSRRVRRPPTDPVNAVLSLLYTFLFNRVYAAIRAANLDPFPGLLHAPDYGRFSLVMDLMEEFRVIVADTLTLALFNLKILQRQDFVVVPPAPPPQTADDGQPHPDVTADPYGLMTRVDDDPGLFDVPNQRMADTPEQADQEDGRGKPAVKLVPEAFARVVENFERKLATEFHYAQEGRSITYNEALTAQALMFRKLAEGALDTYQPLLLK